MGIQHCHVSSTSMQHDDVVLTLMQHCIQVMFPPLGSFQVFSLVIIATTVTQSIGTLLFSFLCLSFYWHKVFLYMIYFVAYFSTFKSPAIFTILAQCHQSRPGTVWVSTIWSWTGSGRGLRRKYVYSLHFNLYHSYAQIQQMTNWC